VKALLIEESPVILSIKLFFPHLQHVTFYNLSYIPYQPFLDAVGSMRIIISMAL
jgi:hypothetical protein